MEGDDKHKRVGITGKKEDLDKLAKLIPPDKAVVSVANEIINLHVGESALERHVVDESSKKKSG